MVAFDKLKTVRSRKQARTLSEVAILMTLGGDRMIYVGSLPAIIEGLENAIGHSQSTSNETCTIRRLAQTIAS